MAKPNIKRIVLTREESRNGVWAEQLQQAGLACLELPLVRFVRLEAKDMPPFATFDWILFTSPQGVRAFADLHPTLGEARCGALGHGTAAAVRESGWTCSLNAAGRDGADLAARFTAAVTDPAAVLLPGPRRRLEQPRRALEAAGHRVTELPLYETLPAAAADIAAAELGPEDVLFFCSPSAVRAFAGARDDKPQCVAIGNTTAAACRSAGFTPAVADSPDLDAMLRAAGLAALPGATPEPVKPELES